MFGKKGRKKEKHFVSYWFFCDLKQRDVGSWLYRRFGTISRSHHQGSSSFFLDC